MLESIGVAELVADDVQRGDPLVGRVVADRHVGAVPERVLVIEADAEREAARRCR